MASKILKFGGTSVRDAAAIKSTTTIVKSSLEHDQIPIVVVSALGGVTNQLIALAEFAQTGSTDYQSELENLKQRHVQALEGVCSGELTQSGQVFLQQAIDELADVLRGVSLLRELTPRSLDFILSFGERLSARIVSLAFLAQGMHCEYLDARLVIRTDDNFTEARVAFEETDRLLKDFFASARPLQVMTGFIASTDQNETTTLGRGGSDFSASIVASALQVEVLEIWTDVNGVMSADPRKVPQAFSQPVITYEEAMELSHFGAKVIHPPTLAPVREKGIPLVIRNTFEPEFPGTRVSTQAPISEHAVTGISSVSNVSLLRVQGPGVWLPRIRTRLFAVLAESGIPIKLITQGSFDQSLCFAVGSDDAELARDLLEAEFELERSAQQIEKLLVESGLSLISAVGENMRHKSGVSGALFGSLGDAGISVIAIAQGSSERNISLVVKGTDETRALNAIHHQFFGARDRLNIVLFGAGNVGSELIAQLAQQLEALRKQEHLDLRLIGVASSKQAVFDVQGLSFDHWQEQLKNSPQLESTEHFLLEALRKGRPGHSVFVDCTAADGLLNLYTAMLELGIPVVSANKRTQTGSMQDYRRLLHAASGRHVCFLQEASVGAGLPVLSTLSDLLLSGDQVLSLEAVLSGTLSFLFNNLCAEQSFSAVVKNAHSMGYTEPDPRDDLSGRDVARKLVILARAMGHSLEIDEVQVEALLPEELLSAPNTDVFMQKLPIVDKFFESRRLEAQQQDSKLIYLARIEAGRASVSLECVPAEHPFFSLSGSDNMISFRTRRYNPNPLVIRGPGAGAQVTASAVFADILRTQKILN